MLEWDYSFVIAVDFDGTLCIGEARDRFDERILRFTKKVKNMGCVVILWTSRCDAELQDAIDMCASRGLYFDYINEYPKRTKSPKICADMYVDNKSVPYGKIPIKRLYKQVKRELRTGEYHKIERL